MKLEELEVFQLAAEISDLAWEIYQDLPQEFKFKLGQQFLDAADSIGANISEGYGRFHYKDALRFYYFSRGSLFETDWWTGRLSKRSLIQEDRQVRMERLIDTEKIKLNNFISCTSSRI